MPELHDRTRAASRTSAEGISTADSVRPDHLEVTRETAHALNVVFNRYRLNSIHHTVSVSQVVRDAASEDDLGSRIERALKDNPYCVATVLGSEIPINGLRDLACFLLALANLDGHDVAIGDAEWFVRKVFVHDTWTGHQREIDYLRVVLLEHPDARLATAEEDARFAVDIIVPGRFGIQLKPESYRRFNMQDALNREKNERLGLPVRYVYYDGFGGYTSDDAAPDPSPGATSDAALTLSDFF